MSGDATPTSPPRAAVLRRIFETCLGFAVALVLVDRVLGQVDEERNLGGDGLLVPDPLVGWTNEPGWSNPKTQINALGLRSPEIEADAPPDEVRVLGLGDSRVYGAGAGGPAMDETWSHYLEGMLDRRGPFRVLNGAVMGYSAVQASRRGIGLLDRVAPDLVLLFLSPGAQVLLDRGDKKNWVRVEGELLPIDLAERWPRSLIPLVARVHRLLLHSNLYLRFRSQFQRGAERDGTMSRFVLSHEPPSADVEELLARTFSEISALQRACDERGIRLRAVLIAEHFGDSQAVWDSYLVNHSSSGAPPPGTPRREPLEVLEQRLADLGVESWSFFPELTRIGTDRKRFTVDESHWSPDGHRLIAAGILERLEANDLVRTLPAERRTRPRR